jgi:DNA-binding NarL/FixJ family response regulator
MTPIRILSVDDNALLREGLAAVIGSQSDMILVSQAENGAEAIRRYREHRPDVTLMDLRLPDLSGIDTTIAIRTEFPDARVIMLTTFEDDAEYQRSCEVGAKGYLLKDMPPNQLLQAIRRVHAASESHRL